MQLLDAVMSTRYDNPCCIGWHQKSAQWVKYDPREPPPDVEPEFFCTKGHLPLPLNETARRALISLMVERGALKPSALSAL